MEEVLRVLSGRREAGLSRLYLPEEFKHTFERWLVITLQAGSFLARKLPLSSIASGLLT